MQIALAERFGSGAKWLLAAADDEAEGGNLQAVDIVHQESTEVPCSNKPVKESRYGRATYASRIKARLVKAAR